MVFEMIMELLWVVRLDFVFVCGLNEAIGEVVEFTDTVLRLFDVVLCP